MPYSTYLFEDETSTTTKTTTITTTTTTSSLSISESQVVFWPADPEERSSSVQLTCTSLVKLIQRHKLLCLVTVLIIFTVYAKDTYAELGK